MNKSRVTIEDIIAVLFEPIPEFKIMHEKSALLLINFRDYKPFFVKVAVNARMSETEANEALNDFDQQARKAANNAGKLLKACRDKGFEVVHIKSEATPGKKQQTVRADRKIGLAIPSGVGDIPIYEAVEPKKGELVFSPPNYEAFTGTRLDFVLRNMNIDSLLVCGLMTNQGVLLSTIQAVNLGYNVILIEDACATFTQETHNTFIKWYKTFVNVKTVEEILNLL